MKYTWLFIIPPIAIAIIIFIAWYRYRIHSHDRDLKRVAVIAHTKTIKMLPAYRRAVTRYRILMACAAVTFLAALFSLTAVAARPTYRDERRSESEKRDVVLCIDVSGSTAPYMNDLLSYFKRIISDPDMSEQRIAITIFDGKPANLVPPTDDYDALLEMVDSLLENYKKYDTSNSSDSPLKAAIGTTSSSIGNGVMGCINTLDLSDENQRAKSIIIATDNFYGSNSQSIDIGQAARYAKQYNITFYGIYVPRYTTKEKNEFIDAVKVTNGSFYDLKDYYEDTGKYDKDGYKIVIPKDADHTLLSIINEIMDQETAKMKGAPEVLYTDRPEIALYISGICFVIFVALIWRLKL